MIEQKENTAISYPLYPFGLLDTALETMPLFAVKRFRSMSYTLHIANAFCGLKLSQAILFGPCEETTKCSQPPVDRRRSSWRDLFLEKLTIGTNIRRSNLIDVKFADRLGVPGDKMGEIRKIGACCVPAGIFGMKMLLECFEDLWKINSIGISWNFLLLQKK